MREFTHIKRARDWYMANERRVASLSLLTGFLFDAFTLSGVDSLRDNLWIAINLIVVGTCIVILNRKESIPVRGNEDEAREHFWLVTIQQFSFGTLLGTFFIFYFWSSTVSVSWPFLIILLLALVSNDVFKKNYERLIFQISFFYLSIFLFSIFIIPLLLHRIGASIFILSGIVSLIIMRSFSRLLEKYARERFVQGKRGMTMAVLGIFTLINILYFTNLIPPIPLSLKDGGVYHSISRNAEGEYVLEGEEQGWLGYVLPDLMHVRSGASLYVYSAIYSPAELSARIVHEWQYKDEEADGWVTRGRIPLTVSGGREEGFRTYSEKSNLTPGKWRVNVRTVNGQIIGRINFRVEAR